MPKGAIHPDDGRHTESRKLQLRGVYATKPVLSPACLYGEESRGTTSLHHILPQIIVTLARTADSWEVNGNSIWCIGLLVGSQAKVRRHSDAEIWEVETVERDSEGFPVSVLIEVSKK